MKKLVQLLCLALLVGIAQADPIIYSGPLTGPSEEPPNASPATGTAVVTLDTDAETLAVDATFEGLLGNTTASHIHCCTAAAGMGTAGVATTVPNFLGFPLGVTSGTYQSVLGLLDAASYNSAFVTANGGLAGARSALITGLSAGTAYFNIHTEQFRGGEIRGFLNPVPEPSTLALISLPLAAIALIYRRRRPSK